MNKKLNIEIGTKFGKWTVISDETIKKNNLTHWKCQCECGLAEYVPLNNLMNGSSTQCKMCAAKESGKKRRKGYENISGDMWSQIKNHAKKKDLPFDLRIEEAWDLYEKQNRKCFFTGESIHILGYPFDKKQTTAVLTLVNPELGYKKDNILWIHRDVAKLKRNMSFDEFNLTISRIKI